MKTLIRFVVSLAITSPLANAQVLDPTWVYGKVLQRALSINSKDCKKGVVANRKMASTEGLETRLEDGWKLVENKPATVKNRTLLLPGFLGTDQVFHDMLADPEMEKSGIKMIAGDAPGFGGMKVPPGFDFSIESYADLVEKMAAKEHIDTLVGHSYMATVLTEVAKRGKFKGKIVLMSPALDPDDEPISTRALDLITRDPLSKDVAWAGMYEFMGEACSEFFQSGDIAHRDAMAEEAVKTPIHDAQKMLKQYFNYLRSDDNSFVKNASKSAAEIHYVSGGKDIVQLKDENKKILHDSGKVTFHYYPNASHMIMIDESKKMNQLIENLASTP